MNVLSTLRLPRLVTLALAMILSLALAVAFMSFSPLVARADTAPIDPTNPATPPTVSADALPTTQIDGVAWAQVVVGNTVYVAGKFTTARPAGAAAGVNTVVRNNLLAYDITTGNLISSFAPSLNAQALGIAASPDGSRIYVVGDFTSVDGVAYYRAVAISTATGKAIPSFRPILESQGRAVVATNSTVYLGGTFSSVNGQARGYAAQVNASDGSVTAWNPSADLTVEALALTPDGSRVILGGRFSHLGGGANYGLGAADASSGAVLPWAANQTVKDGGTKASITSLYATNDRIYGSGYVFGSLSDGNLEGIFSADPDSGAIQWVEDCHGDTYSVWSSGDVVYGAGHPHYCGNVGGFPQTDPWTYHHTIAFSKATTGTLTADPLGYWNWAGTPSPTLLNWFPQYVTGSFTGQGQAAWSLAGNSKYLVVGGEFPFVNGVAQYGLTRFAIPSIAPNKVGPNVNTALIPAAASFKKGEVRVSWTATYDQDNKNLTYKVVRDNATATPVYTTSLESTFWQRPEMGFIDKGLVPGSTHTYRVYATDPFGNSISRLGSAVTVAAADSGGAYNDAVAADSPSSYWPLDETSGAVGFDHVSFTDLKLASGVTRGADGIVPNDPASIFDGTSNGTAATPTSIQAPDTFTTEAWIKTTTTSGGKIIGYGAAATGQSNSYDRQTYMDNSGHIIFGVYTGNTVTVNSANTYNDGAWHQVVSSMGPNGMLLYVDGMLVGSRNDTTIGQPYSGYWRVGGDNLGGWPNQPASNFIAGNIGQVAVYSTVLTRQQIVNHYVASGRVSPIPPAPADAYGKAVYDNDPLIYWRLNDTDGTAKDSGAYNSPGTYNGSVTHGVSGAIAGNSATSFDSNAMVASNQAYSNPTTYSLETWFKTTTNVGGKIIGFGNSQTGLSSNYDRHVYMQDNGTLAFGVWTGQTNLAITSASYNDGNWHHLVAEQSSDGMKLFVDGSLQATNPQTGSQAYDGYWKIGGDVTWNSSSYYFAGTLDEAAVYGTALSAADVLNHYNLGSSIPNVPPVAAFSSTTTDLTSSFDGSGSTDPDGSIVGYAWDFGDSNTGTGATATHTYTLPGTYVVSLTVTDNRGATNTVTHSVTATLPNVAPTAAFTTTATDLAVAVNGSGSTDTDGTVASYAWDFGDGATASGSTANHTFAAAGTYTISLTVTDDKGATGMVTHPVSVLAANVPPVAAFGSTTTNLSAAFDASASTDSDGTIVSYAWDFGDSKTGTGVSPTHVYTLPGSYVASLTVTDNRGGTSTVTHSVTVTAPNVAPMAAFTSTATNLTVATDATSSTDSDGSIVSYAWDFGDSSTASGVTASHTYAAPGTFTIALTVTDNSGATNTVSHSVTVLAANIAPVAAFSSTTNSLTASFDSSASADSDGTIASYAWNFGDSTTGSGASPTHTYLQPGSYVVSLTVTDNRGGTNTVTHSVTVVAANVAPTAAFSSTASNLTASFTASASNDPDGTIASYSWDFGDSSTGSGVAPAHTYAAAGTFTVSLTVTDNQGATNTVTHPVTVSVANVSPTAAFTSTVSALVATFDGSTSVDPDGSIASYAWNFGDSGTSTGATPSHTYAAAGSYIVTLTVTDNSGATNAVTHSVTVSAPAATTLAQDNFGRTVASGWGSADIGGAWTITGTASNLSVGNGVGQIKVAAGSTRIAALKSLSSTTTDTTAVISLDSVPTGGGSFTDFTGRQVGTGSYTAEVWVRSTGAVFVVLEQGSTVLKSVQVGGLTYTAGAPLKVRVQVTGTSPTTIQAKVWPAAGNEPTAWSATTTDSTPALQSAGSFAIGSYLSGSATAAVTTSFDNLLVSTVGAPPANQAPVAAFTSTSSNLVASFTGTGSSDPDGTIASYSWNYGDSTTGTGATSSHTYAAAGTFTASLTVTDNQGATNTVSHPVTVTAPAANQAPVAAFTSTSSDLVASFSGTGSSDPDGTIASYSWNYGDSTTGTGATSSHTYGAAGTFTASLTVTDNQGATNTVSHPVTVTAPVTPPANILAQAQFGTAVANSWGSAEIGGAWTNAGTASAYSVAGGVGLQVVPGGSTKTSSLAGVSSNATDLTVSFSLDKMPTGGGAYISAIGRDVGSTNYQARVWVQSNGAVQLQLLQGGTAIQLVNVTGLTFTTASTLNVRLQVFGTSPTTVRAKVWSAVAIEPAAWLASATDSTAALQIAGSVGLRSYLSGTATDTPVTTRFDNFTVSKVQ
ncbi:PKD domain-containing protein [Lacisediminihabitans sp. H27-G8]|uniref:PKD domain-containing protein n=1 Tax=Lacisediminihabitans sp. H27-G8 TaxID=3111909 RepID=UPI0038FC4F38